MDVFTTNTMAGLAESLRSAGYLEAVTAGVFGTAFCIAYLAYRRTFATGAPIFGAEAAFLGARLGLGAIFFVMGGLNGFLQFVPEHPSSLAGECAACGPFLQGIASTGYLFPLIKGVELVAGALLLLGLWLPVAAILLAPIAINITLYHFFLDPAGLPIALLIAVLYTVVMWSQRAAFLPLLRARVADPAIVVAVARGETSPRLTVGVPQARRVL